MVESSETIAIKHFTDLRVWQKAHELYVSVYKEIDKLPRTVAIRAMLDEVLHSTGSISAKIAEGFNSRNKRRYVFFLDVALRSTGEAENWLHKLVDCVLMERIKVQPWLDTISEIQRMLRAMIKKLDKRNNTHIQPVVSSSNPRYVPQQNRLFHEL
jgi:four helix bundle protein